MSGWAVKQGHVVGSGLNLEVDIQGCVNCFVWVVFLTSKITWASTQMLNVAGWASTQTHHPCPMWPVAILWQIIKIT